MFRSREMSNVEKVMFEAGIDVRSGIGKYALSKVIEIGSANKFADIALNREFCSIVGQGIAITEKECSYLRIVEFGTFEPESEWFVAVWDFEKDDEWIRYAYNYKSNTEKIVDWNYRYV